MNAKGLGFLCRTSGTVILTTAATSLIILGACGAEEPPSVDYVEGWPPATPLESEKAPLSSNADMQTTRASGRRKVSSGSKRERKLSDCEQLVERACSFLGIYSQECIQARARAQRVTRRNELRECKQILATFELTHANDKRRNPCWVLSRRVCEDRGRATKECKDRRESVKRRTRAEDKQAGRGDLLLEEARDILGSNL